MNAILALRPGMRRDRGAGRSGGLDHLRRAGQARPRRPQLLKLLGDCGLSGRVPSLLAREWRSCSSILPIASSVRVWVIAAAKALAILAACLGSLSLAVILRKPASVPSPSTPVLDLPEQRPRAVRVLTQLAGREPGDPAWS